MSVDRILQWCVYNDYPLFREHAEKYRDRVNKIILYPSRHHGKIDLEAFARKNFPETWVAPVPIDFGVEDWRQAETMPLLAHSDSEWIWFTEQDFFCKNWDKFYEDVEKAMKYSDMVGWWNDTHFPYMHPSCLFIKRELLEKTKKDFSAHPEINGCDHFAMISKDAMDLGAKITSLQSLGYKDWEDAFHLGGLTYVYQDWKGDGTDVFGVRSPEAFFAYNHYSHRAPVEQSEEYLQLSLQINLQMKEKFGFTLESVLKWKEFFKQW